MPTIPTAGRLRLFALLAALVSLSACDFTPTLDIDLPEHQPATVIHAVLAADSVATVRLEVSTDPYVLGSFDGRPHQIPEGAVVTLLRDGQPVERLAVRSRTCEDYGYLRDQPATYECGAFVGTVPIEAGGTYAVRAEVPGLPVAEGTVTMPRRPSVSAEETAPLGDGRRQFRVRVQDPAGRGDRYGVALLSGPRPVTFPICDNRTEPPTCRDTTIVEPRRPARFTSADPVLLAAKRDLDIDNNVFGFASVTDASFDGQAWTFTIASEPGSFNGGGPIPHGVLTVQIAALSGDVYDAYRISVSGGQDAENPFIEPVNLPSNVSGGYGLVGAVALAEVTFDRTGAGPPGSRLAAGGRRR